MTVTLWTGSYAVVAALDAGAGKGLDAQGALILSYLQDTMVVMSSPALALFLVAAGAAAARGRSLPARTSWTAVLIGAATFAACLVPASDLAQMEGFLPYLWIVAASIVLAVRPGLAPQSSKAMAGLAEQFATGVQSIIDRHELPWSISRLGARSEYRFTTPAPTTGGASNAAADTELEDFIHVYLANRDVLMTPFHNMALMCPDTSSSDINRHHEAFESCVTDLLA